MAKNEAGYVWSDGPKTCMTCNMFVKEAKLCTIVGDTDNLTIQPLGVCGFWSYRNDVNPNKRDVMIPRPYTKNDSGYIEYKNRKGVAEGTSCGTCKWYSTYRCKMVGVPEDPSLGDEDLGGEYIDPIKGCCIAWIPKDGFEPYIAKDNSRFVLAQMSTQSLNPVTQPGIIYPALPSDKKKKKRKKDVKCPMHDEESTC